ncbi:MAG: hypothetical protein Q9227_008735 [Pyrenula ochraceoflavens]
MQSTGSSAASPQSPTSPTSPTGTKRKRPTELKFYGVQRGRKPGVYSTWGECLAQVKGFKNAMFQAFPNLTHAQAFANGETVATDGRAAGKPKAYYGVAIGRNPGVYVDWPSAQAQIVGWKGPRYKKFATKTEAERFVELHRGNLTNGVEAAADRETKRRRISAPGMTHDPPADADGNVFEAGEGFLPEGAVDGFDPNIVLDDRQNLRYKTQLEKQQKKVVLAKPAAGMLNIYTDGSSLSNGKVGSRAGVGVYFGPDNPDNVSEALKGSRQTNQRAELTAILRALEIAPRHRDVTIFTDSRYAIDCVTNWYKNWEKNGWVTAAKKPVENKELVQEVRELIEARDWANKQTLFNWVKGHNDDPGNVAADRLAINGARSNLLSNGNVGARKDALDDEGQEIYLNGRHGEEDLTNEENEF